MTNPVPRQASTVSPRNCANPTACRRHAPSDSLTRATTVVVVRPGMTAELLCLHPRQPQEWRALHGCDKRYRATRLRAPQKSLWRFYQAIQRSSRRYVETFDDIRDAIDWEKRIKKWNRGWKIRLIEKVNPKWTDLLRAPLTQSCHPRPKRRLARGEGDPNQRGP